MTDWTKIKKEWETTDITFVDLANKHGLKASTIRSRKNREKWQRNATQQKNVATDKGNVARKKKQVAEEVKNVLENDELNDRQKMFCVYYSKYFNATKSYQKAYGCDYVTANTNGPRLLVNTRIKDEINRLKQGKLNRVMFQAEDLFQMYLDIATADITDFVEFGTKEIEKDDHSYISNYIRFKEDKRIDGTIISEIKKGRDGASIKLHDKMKAMEWLDKHIGLATEEQKAKIDKLRAETRQITREDKEKEPPKITIIDRWSEDE